MWQCVSRAGSPWVGRLVGRQARARVQLGVGVGVRGEGSANGKREDEDDLERTRKIYYGPPHLGGEDATAVRCS